MTEVDTLKAFDLDRLEEHLTTRFSPPLRPEDVQRCLYDCAAAYASARIQLYLPLLIERDATTRLLQLTTGPAGDPTRTTL